MMTLLRLSTDKNERTGSAFPLSPSWERGKATRVRGPRPKAEIGETP